MTDLFTKPNPQEETYASGILNLTKQEQSDRITQGVIPPWVEADFLLAKDERRLLDLVEEHTGYLIQDDDWVVVAYGDDGARRVSGFTRDMHMNAEANSKAVLYAAIERGIVTVSRDNDLCGNRVDMTRLGRYYLDLVEHDAHWDLEEGI